MGIKAEWSGGILLLTLASKSHKAAVKLPSISPASHHPNLHQRVHPNSFLPHQARVPPSAQVLHHWRVLVYHHPNLLVAHQSSLWIYTTYFQAFMFGFGVLFQIESEVWTDVEWCMHEIWKNRLVLKTKTVWNNTQCLHWIDVVGFVAIVQIVDVILT